MGMKVKQSEINGMDKRMGRRKTTRKMENNGRERKSWERKGIKNG